MTTLGYWSNGAGSLSIDGTGSKFTVNSALFAGFYGSATINVTNGGMLTNGSGGGQTSLAYLSGSTVNVLVDVDLNPIS